MSDYCYEWSGEKKDEVKWMYTNHIFPMETLWLRTNNDIFLLLRTFGGGHCTFDPDCCEATTGTSGVGGWEEGDIDYLDIDGKRHTLSYDFMPTDETWKTGRVFRYVTYLNE